MAMLYSWQGGSCCVLMLWGIRDTIFVSLIEKRVEFSVATCVDFPIGSTIRIPTPMALP